MSRPALALLAGVVAGPLVSGCVPDPVAWDAPARVAGAPPSAIGDTSRATALPAGLPSDGRTVRCAASVRVTGGEAPGAPRIALWWSVRPDSGAHLLAARSTDGGATWVGPVAVDTLDRGRRGCTRPAPALVRDAAGGYVHAAYYLDAPEGPGVFFAHSMDEGASFHAPVPIVYGERMGPTRIAALGDTVAVAYEDPNAPTAMVALALSRTAGHIFEEKAVRVAGGALPAVVTGVAVAPGGRVVVTWDEERDDGRIAMRRAGTIRRDGGDVPARAIPPHGASSAPQPPRSSP